ncbi:hypothetical protein HDU97_005453, partial [Phlyctochytrium planicorne]
KGGKKRKGGFNIGLDLFPFFPQPAAPAPAPVAEDPNAAALERRDLADGPELEEVDQDSADLEDEEPTLSLDADTLSQLDTEGKRRGIGGIGTIIDVLLGLSQAQADPNAALQRREEEIASVLDADTISELDTEGKRRGIGGIGTVVDILLGLAQTQQQQ